MYVNINVMDRRFASILILCVVGLGAVFWFTKDKSNQTGSGSNGGQTVAPSNHVTGQNAKKVTLVEYGDYQCPACGGYHPLIKALVQKYQADIQFQFRNFPLTIHQNARAAARAAEAADKQGKFWEMHDLLYEQQKSWESSNNVIGIFESYASQLGLNVDTFKKDYASDSINALINADYNEGTKIDIKGTPTFILQGKKINDKDLPRDLPGFEKLIDEAIASANKQ